MYSRCSKIWKDCTAKQNISTGPLKEQKQVEGQQVTRDTYIFIQIADAPARYVVHLVCLSCVLYSVGREKKRSVTVLSSRGLMRVVHPELWKKLERRRDGAERRMEARQFQYTGYTLHHHQHSPARRLVSACPLRRNSTLLLD